MKRHALFLALALSSAVHADSTTELKSQLDQALKTIRDLQNRVNSLEQKQAAPAPAKVVAEKPVAAAPIEVAGAPVVAPVTKADASVVNFDKARIEVSGQVMLDAIYDNKRIDPNWNSTLRPSKIPVYCPDNGLPRDAGCGKNGETIMSVRQSKIAFNGFIPTSLGELKTEFSWDLYDNGGNDSTRPHLLNAWGELGAFGAGQYYTLFMDMDTFPNTIDYWGPSGMIFIRNPQLRYTPYNHDGLKVALSLEAPGAAIDTGKVGLIDPDLGVSSRQEIPDFVANVRFDGSWGHAQAAGIYRKLSFDAPSQANAKPNGSEDGYGINLSGVLNTWGSDRLVAQFAVGRGIAGYMNDGGNDLAPRNNLLPLGTPPHAEAVETIGWFLYYDHYWTEQWSSSIGYSEHSQDNSDGQAFNAFKKGGYASANLLYYPVKNMTVGAELLWGQRENNDGNTGEDDRVQFSTKYTF
ncbi:MAG TPA: hypothetical protein VLC91_12840 [Spongiibacteraceae bacterium]|nr:hypothetical protein [Spongiibacteraceae bacterium]